MQPEAMHLPAAMTLIFVILWCPTTLGAHNQFNKTDAIFVSSQGEKVEGSISLVSPCDIACGGHTSKMVPWRSCVHNLGTT